jgi:hypothetical protein
LIFFHSAALICLFLFCTIARQTALPRRRMTSFC